MIVIEIYRDQKNEITKFVVKGHANADEFGKDIVCASISILSQTSILALYELLKIEILYEIDDGWLFCELPKELDADIREKANLILDTMLIGIRGTKEIYQDFIELIDKEV
ncbi:MAG: ribosomal-processing cysteine protease Prp [Alkaliphilus sp.]|nr:ribosomal-processing cysteine protease Prp [Alkaliphilus sp.]